MKAILLIEDDLVDAIVVKRALRELSVANQLVHCRDSKEALTYLQTGDNEKPCLILLDLNMPGMSGFEFLGSVKEHEQLREIPVMIVSTSSRREDFAESQRLGAAGYSQAVQLPRVCEQISRS